MSKRASKGAKQPDIDRQTDYYKLNTKAVDDLVSANEANSPKVSEAELRSYKSGPKLKIADWVKIVFIKAWFAGASPDNTQSLQNGGLKCLLAAQFLPGADDCWHTCLLCPGESIGVRLTGYHQHDLAGGQLSRRLGVQQGLQVGAAAGDEYRDARLCHRSCTLSPPWTTSPRI